MTLAFQGVRLPLARFTLTLDLLVETRALGVVGPSGAGKTSLLELLAGARRAPAGRITLDGTILDDARTRRHVPSRQRRIGYVPQDGGLFPHLNVRHNILYGARTPAAAPLADILEILEIRPLLDRAPQTLSGGEAQRVAIARALLSGPRLLLFDEPLAGLDAPLKARVLAHLERLRAAYAIPFIYVTHAEDEIRALCEHVLLLREGRLVAQGTPALLDTPPA